ncbi:MAG: hypothetical protein R2764_05170 [Bacteroidales bacterium]
MKKSIYKIFIGFALLLPVVTATAQKTACYTDPENTFRTAIDLFEKEKYGAAQENFEAVIKAIDNPFSQLRIHAEYYDALCALELSNSDAEYKLGVYCQPPFNIKAQPDQFSVGPARLYKQEIQFGKGLF